MGKSDIQRVHDNAAEVMSSFLGIMRKETCYICTPAMAQRGSFFLSIRDNVPCARYEHA
jgi:hypothetical protein